jgi:hypothetical protein
MKIKQTQKCKTKGCERMINKGNGRPNKSGYCASCLMRKLDKRKKMREENVTLIFAIVAMFIVMAGIIAGTYVIMLDDKPIGFKTESHWYRCDAALCQQERENNCAEYVKMSCEVCCEK